MGKEKEEFLITSWEKGNSRKPEERKYEKENKKFIAYRDLEEISSLAGAEIVRRLTDFKDLETMIRNSHLKEDWVVLILKIIKKLVESDDAISCFLVKCLLQNPAFGSILQELLSSSLARDEYNRVLDMCSIIVGAFNYLWNEEEYTTASNLPLVKIQEIIEQNFAFMPYTNDSYRIELSNLIKKINGCLLMTQDPQYGSEIYKFRSFSTEPKSEELLKIPEVTWSAHIEKGSYLSWDKYLNNMFHLMREVLQYRSKKYE